MIIEYWPEIVALFGVNLLGLMSPGPDFAFVVKQSLTRSRREALFSTLGIGMGISVHILYSLLGVGLIISQSIVLFSLVKYVGAGYLIYIGIKSLKSRKNETVVEVNKEKKEGTSLAALRAGFLTNALNPKATLFVFALFTQLIDPNAPFVVQLIYAAIMVGQTLTWFGLISLILSHSAVVSRFAAVQHRLEQVMGAVLVALGVKIATSSMDK